jgi:DNA-directed RNA polymerase subunit H (RpoH/RPB5)
MSAITSTHILSIYNSRRHILSHLEHLGYDVTEHSGFSINEVDAMVLNEQLDMLIRRNGNANGNANDKKGNDGKEDKVYVKYLSGTKMRTKKTSSRIINEIAEDLFVNGEILLPSDTLIIIADGEPNVSLIQKIKYLYDAHGFFIVLHNIARLQYNILQHEMVPKTTILTDEETRQTMLQYNILSLSQFPEISRFDPVALAICMRPGQVCQIDRPSPTASITVFYRVCV